MKKIIIVLLILHVYGLALSERITYQGFLKSNGVPVNGVVNMAVHIWSSFEIDPGDIDNFPDDTIGFPNVNVVDGLFTLTLDSPFIGDSYGTKWLELVINNITQSPRQEITFAPLAKYSTVAGISEDSVRLNGLLSSDFAIATDITGLQSQIDNISTGITPWSDGFGGTQYIGDVIIGDLAASAGDTLQIVSQVDESPLRVLVGGVGTRFRVSKNGGTGIGANYSDGQIPDNGLRVSGKAVIGSLGTTSPSKVTIGADNGVEPLRARIGGATKFLINANGGTNIGGGSTVAPENGLNVEGGVVLGGSDPVSGVSLMVSSPTGVHPVSVGVNGNAALQVASNSGVAIGSGSVIAFPPPSNGLRVSGKSTLSDETTINDDLIVKRDAKHTHTDSYGFVKAGIEFSCGFSGTTRINYFNNINADEITVRNGVLFGVCVVEIPFSYENLYFQTTIEPNGNNVIAGSCGKDLTGLAGTTEVVVCRFYDVENNTNIVTASRVTLLMF